MLCYITALIISLLYNTGRYFAAFHARKSQNEGDCIVFKCVLFFALFPGNGLSFAESAGCATVPLSRRASNRRERLALRNRALVARKYYWEEIMRRRTDDVTIILAENEFFVDERTIQNALMEYADFYTELCRKHVTAKQLQRMFPSFRF